MNLRIRCGGASYWGVRVVVDFNRTFHCAGKYRVYYCEVERERNVSVLAATTRGRSGGVWDSPKIALSLRVNINVLTSVR